MKYLFGCDGKDIQPCWKMFQEENETVDLAKYRRFVNSIKASIEIARKPGANVSRETFIPEDMKP